MRILHISNHRIPYLNDDEGSISDALRLLGHEVTDILESDAADWKYEGYDISLFHHWYNGYSVIPKLPGFKVLWYFDHICFDKTAPEERMLTIRGARRRDWINSILPFTDLICVTDGDFVEEKDCENVIWLPQGADHRLKRIHDPINKSYNVIFPGTNIPKSGSQRVSFVEDLKKRFPKKFTHITNRYREDFRETISSSEIVVAPDFPVTNNYCSNRAYVVTGFGGFLLHPYCSSLASNLENLKEVVFYGSREDLYEKIEYYLKFEGERKSIASRGYLRTIKEHTYTNRCIKLLETVDDLQSDPS